MSMQFLGIQIDAVYHTSVVFNGVEYFYGAGIQSCRAGTTHHGRPIEIVPLGQTHVSTDDIYQYMGGLKSIYTVESYDLFTHNCNNFSNDLVMFLVGRKIPEHIASLPATVLSTPFGQLLRPMLDQSFRQVTQAPVFDEVPANSVLQQAIPNQEETVRVAQSVHDLDLLLEGASDTCAVVFFTSSTCPLCKALNLPYAKLARAAKDKACLIKIGVDSAPSAASRYHVNATPTIMTFLRGKKQEEWRGANVRQLQEAVEKLVEQAQAHPHSRIDVSGLLDAASKPAHFAKQPPLDKLVAKLGDLKEDNSIKTVQKFICGLQVNAKQDNPLPDLASFSDVLERGVKQLSRGSLFALYDLWRAAAADFRVASFYAEPTNSGITVKLLKQASQAVDTVPYNLRLVSLQLACNLFSNRVSGGILEHQKELVSVCTSLSSQGLLDNQHEAARVAAAGLAFNMAAANNTKRAKTGTDQMDEENKVELIAAIIEALARGETNSVVLNKLAMALSLLVYMAPPDGTVMQLLEALDIGNVLKACAADIAVERTGKEALQIIRTKAV